MTDYQNQNMMVDLRGNKLQRWSPEQWLVSCQPAWSFHKPTADYWRWC